jgi:dipeptidyl aminopeptidase/acylaminoacyl peptidase
MRRHFLEVLHADPFLIMHGARDDVNPAEHSRMMEAALHEAGVEVVYFEDPTFDHVSWMWSNVGPWALTFFESHLGPVH